MNRVGWMRYAIGRVWRSLGDWLRDVPVPDAVDRRNAPTLQVVLLMLAALPPLTWLYRATLSDLPWRPGEFGSMLMSLGLSALAAACVALIRRGRFQLALRLLLTLIVVTLGASYLSQGLTANRYEAPLQSVWLIMAGLMAGRRALWLLYACLLLAVLAGVAVDVEHARGGWRDIGVDGLVSAVIFLFIAVVVDRSSTALRESLAMATTRGNELERAKARLEAEIAERERIQGQLIHSQKVEAVGRLAAGVAHDFNHLLTLSLGYAAQGRQSEDGTQLRKALEGIDSAARRAAAVSRKLLTFSHRGEAAIEIFDVNAALAEMQPMLRQLLGPRVQIGFEPADAVQPVSMDRGQFELVVLNLAANAGEALAAGGRFMMSVHPLATAPAQVELRFADDGEGMDEAVRQRIFEPFFTTRPAGRGTGLGLAVAADVIAARGGSIEADSAPGRGTTFRIRLVLAAAELGGSHAPEGVAASTLEKR